MNYTSYTSKIGAWLEKHPVVGLPVHMISSLFRYLTLFRWVIDLVRWMVTTAGNIAESAFLLATVYVTTNTVAHLLVTWILPAQMIVTLNQISTMAFSVLPELIIASAMKTTFDHWKLVWRHPKRVDAWIWASSYTIPTLVFLIMTVLTISTFVNFEAVDATPPQATGLMLVIRCLAGWSYGMVQILFVSIGKQGYVEAMDDLHTQIQARDEALSHHEKTISTLQQDIALLQERVTEQERALFEAQMTLATRRMTRNPLPVANSPVSITPIRSRRESNPKSGLKTTQPLDVRVQLSGLESEQSLDARVQSNGLDTGLVTPQALDSSVHSTRLVSEQSLDGSVQSNGLVTPQALDSSVHSTRLVSEQSLDETVQSSDQISEQREDSTVFSSVHKTGRTSPQASNKTALSPAQKTKAESEAVKKIHRILRRNPTTGPAELAAKTGLSKSYASLVKSQFLTQLAAEQPA